MILIDKPWQYGTQPAYDNVEPELLEFKPNIRVLPARHWYEKKLFFEFIAQYQPGEHKNLPAGGYHVRNGNGASYWFELDQLIIHPAIIEQKKNIVKWAKKDDKRKTKVPVPKQPKSAKPKGRPRLSDEARAVRDEKDAKRTRRLGRPPGIKDDTIVAPKVVTTGKKRGRPPMDPVAKAKRDAADAERQQRSGGKKGRPSNPELRTLRLKELEYRIALNPERKRGRPKGR